MHDLGEVQAVHEEEIRKAIEELNRSTASITKQTETLRQQQDAMSRLVKKTNESQAQRRELEESRQRKSESERKKLAMEVSENVGEAWINTILMRNRWKGYRKIWTLGYLSCSNRRKMQEPP